MPEQLGPPGPTGMDREQEAPRLSRKQLDAWIEEMRAARYWVSCCIACGWYFAQKRAFRGRRAFLCEKQRCKRWRLWQNAHGRAPPEWLLLKWIETYGDRVRRGATETKRHPEEQRICAEAA